MLQQAPTYVYSKKRKDFGRPVQFADAETFLLANIQPTSSLNHHFVRTHLVDREIQCSCNISVHDVNTEHFTRASCGINHVEGGWPKDIDHREDEQATRFRKKVEKDESYISSVLQLGNVMEHFVKQNNVVDIYEQYFPSQGQEDEEKEESATAKTINLFKDFSTVGPPQPVRHVSWSTAEETNRFLAVAYCPEDFGVARDYTREAFVWDAGNPSTPLQTLWPPSAMVTLEFCPRDSSILLGGCHNGQIVMWDLRRGSSPVEKCLMSARHQNPAYNVIWMATKNISDCFSASTDGQVMWWDVRKLRSPVEQLILDCRKAQVQPSLFHAYKARALEYDPSIPTKFLVGTEGGDVLCCNRKAKSQTEKITNVFPNRHRGPIPMVRRNPYVNKCFLTVGDWTAKISSEEVKDSHIFTVRSDMAQITDGCWSPTSPSIFYLTKWNGEMDVWDILLHQHQPVLSIKVSAKKLCCITIMDTGQVVAAGSAEGTVTLFQMSPSFVVPQRNGKSLLASFFEREVRREKILEGRVKELKLRSSGRVKEKVVVQTPSWNDKVAEVEANFLAILDSNKDKIKAEILTMEGGPEYKQNYSNKESEEEAEMENNPDNENETPTENENETHGNILKNKMKNKFR